MKNHTVIAILSLAASPAFAGAPASVPEMSAGAGIAAIALLGGIAAILREKFKK
ncbi:hypothetical protein [Hyphococcus sp.]|uniref:hypothetical protein n=1 Tax=Hyphococcus sp. TaxID=2038636 RepID=UPI0020887FD6|nr:MAG: hypothetical protein DHS20C04_25630 [Marinicaulis sp.]